MISGLLSQLLRVLRQEDCHVHSQPGPHGEFKLILFIHLFFQPACVCVCCMYVWERAGERLMVDSFHIPSYLGDRITLAELGDLCFD